MNNKSIDFLSLKKNLKKNFSDFKKVKIAILGDSATQFIHQALRGYSYEIGYNFEIYEAEYNQIEQEIVNPSSQLYTFSPDYIIILESTQKLASQFYFLDNQKKKDFGENHINYIRKLITTLSNNSNAKIVSSNFIEFQDSIFGNYANKVDISFLFQVRKINYLLMTMSQELKNLFICDVNALALQNGLYKAIDQKLYITSDVIFSLDFIAEIAKTISDIIGATLGKIKKCVIIDLDNTIWGGVIGDDGLEKIQIGNLGIGKAFSQFQLWLKQLKERGIILAVCSKNTENIAKQAFEKHPDMILRLDDIALFVANWENKNDNISYIQSVLNIGFDSMVFLDDNPFERNLVKQQFPAICVPDLPEDPSEYISYLSSLNLFETASYSTSDVKRTKQYQEEAKREELKKNITSIDDYLKSLKMISTVKAFQPFDIPRIAQLTQRSNQFNLRTVRYTEDNIMKISKDKNKIGITFTLDDIFGSYGLIGIVILNKKIDSLFIDTWIMSCRVLKRGMEEFIINTIVEKAKINNIKSVIGEYIPTTKNIMVKDLYKELGFQKSGNYWILDVQSYKKKKTYVRKK